MPYEIHRFIFNEPGYEVIKTVDTLEEAQAHCNDPQTSSRTATNRAEVEFTKKHGDWFDGYEEVR